MSSRVYRCALFISMRQKFTFENAIPMTVNANQERIPACPISGARDSKLLCEVDGYKIWRCPDSATDFVWPMPDEKFLNQVYNGRDWFEGGLKGGYQAYDHQTEGLLPFLEELLSEYDNKGPGR